MIYYVFFITIFCFIMTGLYIRQQLGLKHLAKMVQEKHDIGTNVVLTSKTYSRAFEQVIQAFNLLFSELQLLQVTTQQEKATLDLAIHNITHDVRTPLTIANGYLYQLKNAVITTDEQATVLQIEHNLKTVANRLEVLLEYQDLLENNVKPNLIPVNFSRFFKEQLVTYYDALTQHHFSVAIDIAEELWIEQDREILARIFQNIFSNVLKHGKGYADISIQKEGKFARMIVKNQTNHPIDHLDRLTTRFYSESLAEIEDSSGLGLYIVQELVTLSHGYLELTAQGQDFTVQLSWPLIK